MTDTGQVSLREFFDEKFKRLEDQGDEQLRELKEIKAKQDITNGRVRSAEIAIAVLQVGYAIGGALFLGALGWMFGQLK